MNEFEKAMAVVMPDGSDWLVTVVPRSGPVRNRRISPGTITEDQAVEIALSVERLRRDQLRDLSVRRVGDRRLEVPTAGDPLSDLIRRIME